MAEQADDAFISYTIVNHDFLPAAFFFLPDPSPSYIDLSQLAACKKLQTTAAYQVDSFLLLHAFGDAFNAK